MDATALPIQSRDANPVAGGRGFGRWAVLLIVLIGVSVATIRLAGPPDLMDNEQQLQSAYVMDALQNGHWLCQRDETGSITSKPPVYTWLAALATLPAGRISRLSTCLPSILGNIALALLLMRFGRRHFSREAGFLSAAVYLLSYPGARQIGLARMDGLFPFTTTLAALAAFIAWQRGRGWLWFWLAAAVGTLTKGPVTLVIGAAGLAAILWERHATPKLDENGTDPFSIKSLSDLRIPNTYKIDGKEHISPQLGANMPPRRIGIGAEHAMGVLLFLLLTLGWFAASCQVMGRPVFQKLILDGLLGQSVQTHNGHWPGQQFFAPPLYLLSRFLPGSLLTCVNLWRIWRDPSQDDAERRFERFVACWLVIGIIPFCIAPHQRADLIAPIYPPAALLAGRELARLLRLCAAQWRAAVLVGGVMAALVILALKYDHFARRDVNVAMTLSVRDFAQTLEHDVGADFPLTHVDDPYALQVYLNTMRPVVSYAAAAQLLEQDAAAFVVVSRPDLLRQARAPGGAPVYDVSHSVSVPGHHGIHVMSNRPELRPEDRMAMAVGALRVETEGLRWVHAAECDFTFAGRGSVKFTNAGSKPVALRVILQRPGEPVRASWVLQPGEMRGIAEGG